MLSIFLFLAAGLGLVFSKKILGDYFSPPALYHFFWSVALGALTLEWVSFDPLTTATWQAIMLSYAGFMCGSLLPLIFGLAKPGWLTAEPSFEYLDRRRMERTLLVLFLLGIGGFIFQLAHLQAQIGLSTFLDSPTEARELHTNIKFLGFFNILNVANFVISLMYLILYKRPAKWVVFIMLWALATTFVTTDRTRFFYMVIWSFFIGVYLYRRVRLNPTTLMAVGFTLLSLFGFFLLIARVYEKEAFEDNMEFVNIDPEYAFAVDPYIYLTGSFPVFQAFMEDKRELTYGKASFAPVVTLIETVYPDFEREALVGKFYRVPIELNACTYLEPYYKDFGWGGLLLGPLLTGFLCGWAYLWMRARKTLFSVYFAALLSFCTTISIFVNHFTQIATWYFVVAGYVVYRVCHTRQPQPKEIYRPGIYGS